MGVCKLQLSLLLVSTYRQVLVTTTRLPHANRLTSPTSTFLQNIGVQVDAAYNIPAKGAAYIFTGTVLGTWSAAVHAGGVWWRLCDGSMFPGQKYWLLQKLQRRSSTGSIYEFGFPSRVRQLDAAVHVGEKGKTFFFTGDFYYR